MEELDRLRANLANLTESDRVFANSLLAQAGARGLSIRQREWVARLAERASRAPVPSEDFSAIMTFMQEAGEIVAGRSSSIRLTWPGRRRR